MTCVKGHQSIHNHVDNDHEFCFGDTIRYELGRDDYFRFCQGCEMTYAMCDIHNRGRGKSIVCHATQVAFLVTSCKYNGTSSAIAGFGIVLGDRYNQEWAVPVNNRVDRENRTNNRTDLLAALECIRKMVFAYTHPHRPCEARPKTWIVASCSDYVVKNYIQNFDNWRARGWQKSSGGQPANLDLWIKLDNMREKYEDKYGVRISFYRAPARRSGNALVS